VYEQIARNRRRTWVMVIAFTVFTGLVLAAVIYLFGGSGPVGIAIAAVIAIVTAWISYWNSDKVALAMSRARPADPKEHARLHNLVEGLCIASGLPKPRVYLVDDPAPNAFATGRSPKHAAIAVTTGLLEKMSRVELEGVLAHELSHIRNYDTLVMTIAVTMVGLLVLVADFFLRFLFWGGRRRDDSGAGAILGLVGIVLLIFSPLVARAMQFAISRRREYLADASGVQLTRYPPGLIAALEKLRDDGTVVRSASRATAPLWIEEPLEVAQGARGSNLNRLFATHPPLDDRIAALREM
jgi:heat shock protein HtpX